VAEVTRFASERPQMLGKARQDRMTVGPGVDGNANPTGTPKEISQNFNAS
jgi:hypothetical protein